MVASSIKKLQDATKNLSDSISDSFIALDERRSGEKSAKDSETLINIGGGIGGLLLGSYLGSNFGTIGKIGGGILGAFVAPKLINGIAVDAACASDYVEEGKKQGKERNWFGAFGSNLLNFSGQTYKGITEDADPDVCD